MSRFLFIFAHFNRYIAESDANTAISMRIIGCQVRWGRVGDAVVLTKGWEAVTPCKEIDFGVLEVVVWGEGREVCVMKREWKDFV